MNLLSRLGTSIAAVSLIAALASPAHANFSNLSNGELIDYAKMVRMSVRAQKFEEATDGKTLFGIAYYWDSNGDGVTDIIAVYKLKNPVADFKDKELSLSREDFFDEPSNAIFDSNLDGVFDTSKGDVYLVRHSNGTYTREFYSENAKSA